MSSIFISYNHQSEAIVRNLAKDIEALGHVVWFDHELSGGQAWWDRILAQIRECDIFAFVLVPEALNSTACIREYKYAADVNKPILPILVSEEVSTNLLPPALSKIQFVDYRKQDRNSAFLLARSIGSIPPPEPLPDPLPEPPEVPLSYLGGLTEKIESTLSLSYEEQSTVLLDLKRSLRNAETSNDARTLLTRLRQRRDLLASIADEIDEILSTEKETIIDDKKEIKVDNNETSVNVISENLKEKLKDQKTKPTTTQTTSTTKVPHQQKNERIRSSIIGGIIGIVVGLLVVATINEQFANVWPFSLIVGAGGAIAGAISSINRKIIIAAIIGAIAAWLILIIIVWGERSAFAIGGIFGAPAGAVIGAIAGKLILKKKKSLQTN